MTTAIRLYRTYILSTFVPLNTIRTITSFSHVYVLQKRYFRQFCVRPRIFEFLIFIYINFLFLSLLNLNYKLCKQRFIKIIVP